MFVALLNHSTMAVSACTILSFALPYAMAALDLGNQGNRKDITGKKYYIMRKNKKILHLAGNESALSGKRKILHRETQKAKT